MKLFILFFLFCTIVEAEEKGFLENVKDFIASLKKNFYLTRKWMSTKNGSGIRN